MAFFLLLFGVVDPLIAFPRWMLVAGLAVPLLPVILGGVLLGTPVAKCFLRRL